MIRDDLTAKIRTAVAGCVASGALPEAEYIVDIIETRSPDFGDFATNFALTAAPLARKPPIEIATAVANGLKGDASLAQVAVAQPGFINLRLSDSYLWESARKLLETKEGYARSKAARPENVLIEFVSVNPNGPLHVGHGRNAAYGDVLARVLEACGHHVSREYYVNDGKDSLQMQLFALSVKARYRELLGLDWELPEGGYKGEYVAEAAGIIRDSHGDGHADDGLDFWQPVSASLMLEWIRRDVALLGVRFDSWFSEQSLYDSGEVERVVSTLVASGHVYEHDGALYLRSAERGDEKDRVIRRKDGRWTYLASDVAYHKNKYDRGFERLIDVWGADHHGYVARTVAAIEALGYDPATFEAVITQLVRFVRGGETVSMSTRSGAMITLVELIDDVGVDVARFFYLMRSHDTHMDFDLDLAREHSERNPVYYVQYAHARICSVLAKAKAEGFSPNWTAACSLEAPERTLILKLWDLPFEVRRAAESKQVHRLTTYAVELARIYHDFYERCRVIAPQDPCQTENRLCLCECTRIALRATFELLGISAPERM